MTSIERWAVRSDRNFRIAKAMLTGLTVALGGIAAFIFGVMVLP